MRRNQIRSALYAAQWRRALAALLRGTLCALLLGMRMATAWAQNEPAKPAKAAAPEWAKLCAAYAVDTNKTPEVKEEPQENDQAMVLKLSFISSKGDKVPGLFERPKAEGVYPCVLLLHGLTSKKEDMIKVFAPALVKNGIAVLALDAPMHGERKKETDPKEQQAVFAVATFDGIHDYRTILSYLTARKDVDRQRIGLLGYSMGAMMGAILGGVEDRISAFVLCVGGDAVLPFAETVPEAVRDRIYRISPSLYVSHIAPRPLLMLNGRQDRLVPAAASKRLYDAAKDPKQIEYFDCGHLLTPDAIGKSEEWLTEKLKGKIK